MDFVVPANNRVKLKEIKNRDKYRYFSKELKKLWNMSNWYALYSHQRFDTRPGGLGNKRTNEDYGIVEIG